MRRIITALLLAGTLALAGIGSALGHVHGITPLGCMTNDAAIAGANGTDGTAADDANGGPIGGLIPRDVGNAPLTVGDGGRHASFC